MRKTNAYPTIVEADWFRWKIPLRQLEKKGPDVPLFYPKFSGIFIIHTYTIKIQLGRVISGKWSSIAVYSHK